MQYVEEGNMPMIYEILRALDNHDRWIVTITGRTALETDQHESFGFRKSPWIYFRSSTYAYLGT